MKYGNEAPSLSHPFSGAWGDAPLQNPLSPHPSCPSFDVVLITIKLFAIQSFSRFVLI